MTDADKNMATIRAYIEAMLPHWKVFRKDLESGGTSSYERRLQDIIDEIKKKYDGLDDPNLKGYMWSVFNNHAGATLIKGRPDADHRALIFVTLDDVLDVLSDFPELETERKVLIVNQDYFEEQIPNIVALMRNFSVVRTVV